MEIDLSKAQDGTRFLTKNGTRLIYKKEMNDEEYSPYSYYLKSEATGNAYLYSKDGIYYEKKDPNFDLVAKLSSSSNIAGMQNTNSAPSVPTLSVWGKGTKIIAIVELLLAVVLFFVLIVNDAIAFGVLAYGIIQLLPMMAIAKACDNSEIILHVLSKLNR